MCIPPVICVTVWTRLKFGDERRGDLLLVVFGGLRLRLAADLGVARGGARLPPCSGNTDTGGAARDATVGACSNQLASCSQLV